MFAGLYLSNFNMEVGCARPERPTLDARRAESGGAVLGEGPASPSPLIGGLGERCKLLQRGPWWSLGKF